MPRLWKAHRGFSSRSRIFATGNPAGIYTSAAQGLPRVPSSGKCRKAANVAPDTHEPLPSIWAGDTNVLDLAAFSKGSAL